MAERTIDESLLTEIRRPKQMAGMFDSAAKDYDLINTLLSLGQEAGWRRATTKALDLKPGDKVLDLAAGTGTSSVALKATGAEVLAADLSPGMAAICRDRHPEIDYTIANAISLPIADGVFDAVTMSFGLRNMPDPVAALKEMARVTKPGGRLVICEFSTPPAAWFRFAYKTWMNTLIPLVARLSSHPESYYYLVDSIRAWPRQRAVAGWLVEAGWYDVAFRNLTGGIVALHRGRR